MDATVTATACGSRFLGMCLVIPPAETAKIFGFAEFIQAFAILVLVFTFSDVRTRFRGRTAPISLQPVTFGFSVAIAAMTLLSDLWFSKRYPVPWWLANHAMWQVVLGALFVANVLLWLWYVFVRPPQFSRWNAFNYAQTVYFYLLQGNESDLPTIATELGRSAKSIVKHAAEGMQQQAKWGSEKRARLANDLLLLIAMRKFCRHIIASSPGTAIAFFVAMSEQKKYRIPIGQFASNITTEALQNKDSIIYHEDEGFHSGYFGYVRPFTNAIYGDFSLVEALTEGSSPLDIELNVKSSLDAVQLAAYCRAVLTTFKSYLDSGQFGQHSYSLYRAFSFLKHAAGDTYKLNESPAPANASDIEDRLGTTVEFIADAIKTLNDHGVQRTILRHHGPEHQWRKDFYDYIADLMFEVIAEASIVKTGKFLDWHIQHNIVWSRFVNFDNSPTRKIILFKLRRLLYNNLCDLDRHPNFLNARIAGYCLNVMGLTQGSRSRTNYQRSQFGIHRLVIKWTHRRYHWLVRSYPRVAAAFLMGSIVFDEEKMCLIKTYEMGLSTVAPTQELHVWEAIGPIKPIR